MRRLDQKTALITGAARGIGRAFAEAYIREGAQVAISEKDIIEQALSRNSFSRTNTAKDLGISRVTLYNKMKRYELMN